MADERTVDTPFIFVYGGLMRGFDLHHFMQGATFLGEGWTHGTLVVLGRYPGLLEGIGRVAGEIYKLEDVAASLEALDDLEDFDPSNPDDSMYLRSLQGVYGKGESIVRAWVYVYNRDPGDAQIVHSGDWRQFSRES